MIHPPGRSPVSPAFQLRSRINRTGRKKVRAFQEERGQVNKPGRWRASLTRFPSPSHPSALPRRPCKKQRESDKSSRKAGLGERNTARCSTCCDWRPGCVSWPKGHLRCQRQKQQDTGSVWRTGNIWHVGKLLIQQNQDPVGPVCSVCATAFQHPATKMSSAWQQGEH